MKVFIVISQEDHSVGLVVADVSAFTERGDALNRASELVRAWKKENKGELFEPTYTPNDPCIYSIHDADNTFMVQILHREVWE